MSLKPRPPESASSFEFPSPPYWRLGDVREWLRTDAPPATVLPSTAEVSALEEGDLAKLVFDINDSTLSTSTHTELMWVEVARALGDRFEARLVSTPRRSGSAVVGMTVSFSESHVIDIRRGLPNSESTAPSRPAVRSGLAMRHVTAKLLWGCAGAAAVIGLREWFYVFDHPHNYGPALPIGALAFVVSLLAVLQARANRPPGGAA